MSNCNFPQLYRTLSILADLSNFVIWMVLILPLISSFPSLFSRSLGTVPSVSLITGITATFMFHRFFSSLPRSKCLSIIFYFILFLLYGLLELQDQLVHFLLIQGLVFRQSLSDLFVSQSPREFYASHF